jgi:DNA-binding CsgD family transcriptional regulator
MVAHVSTVAFHGVDVVDVDVQVQMGAGLPAFTIVGLPDKAVRESRERVRAALGALGRALTNALRLVLDGERYVPSVLLEPECAAAPGIANENAPEGGGDAAAALATLSERELDVLRLLARGKSNKEVARDLDLQEATVKTHVTAVFRKLGVSNRTEAAREAFKRGVARPAGLRRPCRPGCRSPRSSPSPARPRS